MTNKISLSLLSLLFASTSALAAPLTGSGQLEGTYVVPKNCVIQNKMIGTVTIPAGKIVVRENIPVSIDHFQEAPALIIQAAGRLHPVLTLTLGKVSTFAYGPEPTTIGAYDNSGSELTELYSSSTSVGFDEQIRLFQTAVGLSLVSSALPEGAQQPVLTGCDLGRKL